MRHRRLRVTAPAILALALLSGCWYGAERAGILVNTTPPGAACTLSRLGQPIATAEPTPAIARVDPGEGEITILCRRRGFADAAVTVTARKAEPDLVPTFSLPPVEYGQRVDITLTPGRR